VKGRVWMKINVMYDVEIQVFRERGTLVICNISYEQRI
jgi:hypothetical protein